MSDVRSSRPPIRPYGDTTGDGMVQVSFTLPMPPLASGRRGRRAAAGRQDGPATGDGRARQGDRARLHVLRRLRPGHHLVDLDAGHGRGARLPAAARPRRSTPRSAQRFGRRLVVVGACIGTDAHTVGIDAILNIKGFAGEKGLEYYRELGSSTSAPRSRVPQLVGRALAEQRRRGPGLARSSPSATRTCSTPGRCRAAFREAYPAEAAPAAGGRRPALRRGDGRRARRRPGLRARHHARRGRAYLVHGSRSDSDRHDDRSADGRHARGLGGPHRRCTAATCRTPTPTTPATSSTAPTCWACSATWPPSCASAPTATRGCSRPTTTCSSAAGARRRRHRGTARWSGSAPGPEHAFRSSSSPGGGRPTTRPVRPACSTHPGRDDGDRHRRRPRLTVEEIEPACRQRHAAVWRIRRILR